MEKDKRSISERAKHTFATLVLAAAPYLQDSVPYAPKDTDNRMCFNHRRKQQRDKYSISKDHEEEPVNTTDFLEQSEQKQEKIKSHVKSFLDRIGKTEMNTRKR